MFQRIANEAPNGGTRPAPVLPLAEAAVVLGGGLAVGAFLAYGIQAGALGPWAGRALSGVQGDAATALQWFVPILCAFVVALLLQRRAAAQASERRMAAEDALRAAAERFADFAETSGDWLWELDSELRFSYVSPRFEAVTGIPIGMLMGRTRIETANGDPADPIWSAHQSDLEARRPFRDFTFTRQFGGRTVHFSISGKPVFDANGRFAGYRGVGADVTREVKLKRRAKAAHRSLVAAMEAMPAGVLLFDGDGRLSLWNSAFGAQFPQLGPSIQSGIRFVDLVQAAAQSGLLAPRDNEARSVLRSLRHLQGGGRLAIELRDGRWIDLLVSKTFDGGIVSAFFDVTGLKRHERELERKSILLQAVLESMDEGISVFDTDLHLQVWNERLLKLLDLPPEFGRVGQSYAEVARFSAQRGEYGAADDVEKVVEQRVALIRSIQAGNRYNAERTRNDGTVIELRGRAVHGGGVVVTYTDVTKRRQAELQLQQSQKMESVGQMAGGMAHEFNNLLTAISGFTRMALRRPGEQDHVKECLDEVISASDRAAELTQKMLAFGRKQVLEPRVVELDLILADLRKMLGPLLGEQIRLHIDPGAAGERVTVDPVHFAQVIVNLAINARDAMPNGGDLTIGTGVVPELERPRPGLSASPDGRYATVYVMDTGVGMDEATVKRIFEPFFTTKDVGKGTGLGLSVALGIVEQSGGVIDVQSTPGKGSTFRILLPLAPTEAARVGATGRRMPERPVPVAGATILLVEDEDMVRRLVRAELEQLGYTVLQAADGAEACEVSRAFSGTIDLLLTDVVMPRMSGPDAARVLSRARPSMKRIFMTGYSSRGQVRRTDLGEGAVVLRKPFADGELEFTVSEVLRAARPASESAARALH